VLTAAATLSSRSPRASAPADTVSRTRAISTLLTCARSGVSASDNSTGTMRAAASQIACRSRGLMPS
jgi:hypothetical protein